MNYCPDCGCKMYGGACTNCHEETYIAEQHYEQGTYNECSDKFKLTVERQAAEIHENQQEQREKERLKKANNPEEQ